MVAALRRSPLARGRSRRRLRGGAISRSGARRVVGAKTDASSRRGRGSKNINRLLLLLFSSRLVAGAHARDVRPCRRVRSAKDSNREPAGAAAARGGKMHDAHFIEMLLLWHLLI